MNPWIGNGIGAAILAALVHVASVLVLPSLAPESLWTRLETLGVGTTGFSRVPDVADRPEGIAALDPATVTVACRYDLADGPVKITGRLDLDYWAIWLHEERGHAYYAINARANGDRALELRIMTDDQLARFRADLPEDAETELLVASPTRRGFVVLRGLVPEPSTRAMVEREISGARCQPNG